MKKKADAWVVLRFDDADPHFEEAVAIKGIYDTRASAVSAVESAQRSNPTSQYTIVKTRHFLESVSQETKSSDSFLTSNIQRDFGDAHDPPEITAVRNLWNNVPHKVRRRVLLPFISYLVERAVAYAIGASTVDDPKTPWDLVLPDGSRVEVKTVIHDHTSNKSPVFHMPVPLDFEFLAVVILRPDLSVEAAKLIPKQALEMYARHAYQTSTGPVLNLRVTPHFLHFPMGHDIPVQTVADPWPH